MKCITQRVRLVLMACECAELSLQYVEDGWTQPQDAISAAKRWAGSDGISIEDVNHYAKKAAEHSVAYGYSAFAETASAAFHAATAVYLDDPLEAARRAIDSTAFANRDETLKKCAVIAEKYGYRIWVSADPIKRIKLEELK